MPHFHEKLAKLRTVSLYEPAPAFASKARRYRDNYRVDRDLGGVGRKSCPLRRTLACNRSGNILSHYGNSLDYPVETVGKMVSDGAISLTAPRGVRRANR